VAQSVFPPFQVRTQHDVHGGTFDAAFLPQMDLERVQVNDSIDSCQVAAVLGFAQGPDFIGHRADGRFTHLDPIHLP
jgi:hypothetical protein